MKEISRQADGHVVSPVRARRLQRSSYEWRVVDIPVTMSRSDARALLTEHAEYGKWELARSVLFVGGARRVWLRRRTMRVVRTGAA